MNKPIRLAIVAAIISICTVSYGATVNCPPDYSFGGSAGDDILVTSGSTCGLIDIYNTGAAVNSITVESSATVNAGIGINGPVAISVDHGGTIGLISNDGSINGGSLIDRGIFAGRNIATLNNNLTGSIGGNTAIYIWSAGDGPNNYYGISTLNNAGTISGGYSGIYFEWATGRIGTINNTGLISGGAFGIEMNSGGDPLSPSRIDLITNNGSITGGVFGISVCQFTPTSCELTTLNNAQGAGNPNGALTYTGNLPVNYNIILGSDKNTFGKLAVTGPNFTDGLSGLMTFGILSGAVKSNRYLAVLSGVPETYLSSTRSGTYSGYSWSLELQSASLDTWDLVFASFSLGPSAADTQQSLVNTASVLQGTFTLQNTVMVNGFTYDCPVFDKNGICVSVGGRNTTVQTQGINNTNGLLIASYRLNKNNTRIGAWVDQNLSMSGPGTVQLGNSTPMIGLFGIWSQRPDGVGAEVKVSAAYGQKDLTVTRSIVGTSEPGSGGSQLISQGAQVVAKYGFAVMPDVVVSPYAGVRYTQNNMGGYTEAATSAVTAPLTYSALNTNATTALAGAEARYRGIPKTTLFASAGVETDTNTSNGSYSATGVSGLTSVNFNPNPVKTRPTATAGAYYDILKNQRIGVTGIYRQEPFQAVSTTTVLATYTIGL